MLRLASNRSTPAHVNVSKRCVSLLFATTFTLFVWRLLAKPARAQVVVLRKALNIHLFSSPNPAEQNLLSPGVSFFSTSTYVHSEGCLREMARHAKSYSRAVFNQGQNHANFIQETTSHRELYLAPCDSKQPCPSTMKNAVIIVIDSLSRAEVMAYLPKVRQLLTVLHHSGGLHGKQMFSFRHALSIDGTTPYAFSALLSGREFLWKVKEPRIWLQDELVKNGYVTKYFGEVWPVAKDFNTTHSAALTNLLDGGTLTNATVFESINKLVPCGTSLCSSNGTDEVSRQTESLRLFWREHRNSSKFAILHFLAAHSPNNPMSISLYDEQLAFLLRGLIKSQNTNIFFLTDHGRVDDEDSFQFPMLATILSTNELNLQRERAMLWNSERMVTFYDLYHTLRHLLLIEKQSEEIHGVRQEFQKSMLVSKLPLNRTCDEAGLPPLICPCLTRSWKVVKDDSTALELERVMRLKEQAGCAPFTFKKINISRTESIPQQRRKLLHVSSHGFFRATIDAQEGVVFQIHGYGTKQLWISSIKQTSAYRRFENCTPEGADPQFCIC